MNSPRSILLVDDREPDRNLAKRVLRKVWPDLVVLEACDGAEAIRLLEQPGCKDPDIILLDINMPQMNGHEFLNSWYADNNIDIPVVLMLTSSELQADRERTNQFSCVRNYIVKPLTKQLATQLFELAA